MANPYPARTGGTGLDARNGEARAARVLASEPLRGALAADTPADMIRVARAMGIPWLCWQVWGSDTVRTWDMMPKGFMEHYYGIEANRFCPIAVGIRRRWPMFTFADAREQLAGSIYAEESEKVWRAFGMEDGAVFAAGRGASCSMLAFATPAPFEPILRAHRDALYLIASRIDAMLREHPALSVTSREFQRLSDKQLEVLRVQIDHPELSFTEQAKMLNISPRMLEKRHKQIAERFGLTSFTAAVAKAVSDGIGLG